MALLKHGREAIRDAELEKLLSTVYVEGGFTDPEVAQRSLDAASVRARGDLIAAYVMPADALAGMVMVVLPSSPARRIAREDEGELHLLAVLPEFRGQGIGAQLVEAAIERARTAGLAGLVLWTQPSMTAAQRLYQAHGFVRRPQRDAELKPPPGRSFLVFDRSLRE